MSTDSEPVPFSSAKKKRIAREKRVKIALNETKLRPFVGHFQMESGRIVNIRVRDGQLWETGNGGWWRLIPVKERIFIDVGSGWEITFDEPISDAIPGITQARTNGKLNIGKRNLARFSRGANEALLQPRT
jgi:hypothetical protein